MVERKKIAGPGGETGAGARPASVSLGSLFIAALFSSFPLSESLDQATAPGEFRAAVLCFVSVREIRTVRVSCLLRSFFVLT